MKQYGFIRVASANNKLKVANPKYNLIDLKKKIDDAIESKVDIISFGELSLCGYTCGDLFFQDILIEECNFVLEELRKYSVNKPITIIVGSVLKIDFKLFNCAIVIENGKYLGVTCKKSIPNYNEFYEKRWFVSSEKLNKSEILLNGHNVFIGDDLLFKSGKVCFGIEICEDLWNVKPKSTDLSSNGANIIFNLSSSNELVGKNEYRKDLIKIQSAKNICAYVYASNNVCESSSDLLFSGATYIYENGSLLCEGERFNFDGEIIYADIDVERLINERSKNTTFELENKYRYVDFTLFDKSQNLARYYSKTPFVPEVNQEKTFEEIINIQSYALARRMMQINCKKTVLGLSGGLDSTLAFLIIVKANKILNIDNKNIIAITMPGFGTTDRTYENALNLAKIFNATLKEISIKDAVLQHFKDIEHDVNIHDITYENSQARERTQILMDVANKENALVIGTGDLSELALGWCTYNGDHMSMYAINSSIPKTLIKYLIGYFKEQNTECKDVLNDILNTPISPELLPPDSNGNIAQKTEDNVGPYILHDFFLYHFLRYGAKPSKIYYIACNTFKDEFDNETILKWLKVFVRRFFTQQFKRNCMPDGVKVGSVSLSPRGDLRMPSDADYEIWLNDLENIEI